MHLNEITKSSDLVYQAKIFHVTKDTAELEDGKIVQRDVVHHSGGVCVVPLTERQTVLMVQQYRYPFHEVTLEIPAEFGIFFAGSADFFPQFPQTAFQRVFTGFSFSGWDF